MKANAKDLIFISNIMRDGKNILMIDKELQEHLEKDTIDISYDLTMLSMTYKTYIASGFNSYVVKLKSNL